MRRTPPPVPPPSPPARSRLGRLRVYADIFVLFCGAWAAIQIYQSMRAPELEAPPVAGPDLEKLSMPLSRGRSAPAAASSLRERPVELKPGGKESRFRRIDNTGPSALGRRRKLSKPEMLKDTATLFERAPVSSDHVAFAREENGPEPIPQSLWSALHHRKNLAAAVAGAFVFIYLLLARSLFQGLRLAFLLTLLSLSAPASLFSLGGISAEFDKEEISSDEKVAFRLRMPSDCYLSQPFPSSEKYKVVSTSSGEVRKLSKMKLSSNFSSLERGPAMQEINHAYILRPLMAGTIAIEPIIVQCANRRLKTFRRELRVVAAQTSENSSVSGDVLDRPVVIANISRKKQFDSSRPVPDMEPFQEPLKDSAFVGLPVSRPAEVRSDSTSDYLRKQYFRGRLWAQKTGLTLKSVAIGTLTAGVIWFFLSFLRIEASRYLKARSENRNLPAIKMRMSDREEKSSREISGKFEGLVLKDKYEIRSQIGAGGMGMVFLADDLKLIRKVAVKKMLPELKYSREDRENFIREAMLISRLTHPYIVGIHEIIEQDGEIYLIFDYVDGKPLTKIIAEKKQLSLKDCQDIFSHVCEAIDCAHRANICHLDLKPANIMVDKNGYAKVMDFGIAREAKDLRAKVTGGLSEAGTLFYMAPEQHLGAGGPSSDVFALGVCLYEMLTGQIPFKGPDFLAQKERMQFVQPGRLVSGLPKQMELLMNTALAPDPKKRIAGALELLELLRSC